MGLTLLTRLLDDRDQRVIPAVLTALAQLKIPEVDPILLGRLKAADFVTRSTAAALPAERRVATAVPALPEADKGAPFFAFEGDRLWTADGRERGLEYLFGVLDTDDEFRPLWAHDRADERKALRDFLTMVRKRRKRYPRMHIYHYAPYEPAALKRLMGRHATCEEEIDRMLRG
jgi:uncharacterized protein